MSEQQIIAQLADHMSEDIRPLPPDQARKRAYAYGSLAHDELLRQGIHDDRATAVIEAALEIVFERFGLGKPE